MRQTEFTSEMTAGTLPVTGLVLALTELENLRFGKLSVGADEGTINQYLNEAGGYGKGNGIGLSDYLSNIARNASIKAYEETIPNPTVYEAHQDGVKLGSRSMFDELKHVSRPVPWTQDKSYAAFLNSNSSLA
jgi:hypothetical protein